MLQLGARGPWPHGAMPRPAAIVGVDIERDVVHRAIVTRPLRRWGDRCHTTDGSPCKRCVILITAMVRAAAIDSTQHSPITPVVDAQWRLGVRGASR
jgi:hypothetical protein